jgi:predicted RecA/RadA family phage recombinase
MITNQQSGNRITYTNPGAAILSGAVIVLASGTSGMIAIAVTDIPASTATDPTGEVCIGGYPEGIHKLAKKVGDVFTIGQLIYWDATNTRLTSTSSGNTRAGRCTEAAASAATTAKIKINQS